ncbi:MAG: Maf family nucleotide pyrophosphatase [Cyclobacteriaceae bacterium]
MYPILDTHRFILASGSPRRQELIHAMGIPYEVRKVEVEETYPKELAHDHIAAYLAKKKALACSIKKNELVFTADTIVTLGNTVLGKPSSLKEAKGILKKLSNSEHQVFTGVCLHSIKKTLCFSDVTTIEFNQLTDTEIDYYLNACSPLDKAGSYGIQEWIGMIAIKQMNGSFYNVMGLPTHLLHQELLSF